MAHMAVFISSMNYSGGNLHIDAQVVNSDTSDTYSCSADVAFNATAATINDALKDAAITELGTHSISVGALDKKTIYAGAMGL